MKKHLILFIIAFNIITFGLSLSPQVVQAVGPLLSNSLIQDAQCSAGNCSLNTFIALGVSLSNIILGLVGALTLAMFIYGGVMLLISGGNSEKISKGKDIILGSVVGLLIVFGSYTIISFVVDDVLGAKKSFSGSAPPDSGNAGGSKGDATICGDISNLEHCIEGSQQCLDGYGREGTPVPGKKCSVPDDFCCQFQPEPTQAEKCEGTGNRKCAVTPTCPTNYRAYSRNLLCQAPNDLCCEPFNNED